MSDQRPKTRQAGLWEHLTPTTAGLLRWWLAADRVQTHGRCSFSEDQRQAIVDTIESHETTHSQRRVAPARHRLTLADETEHVQVLLALLVWQLLNHADARAAGVNDPRFTRHFAVTTPSQWVRDRLLDALWGQVLVGGGGARDFGHANVVRCADMLIPEARRDEVYAFLCASASSGEGFGQQPPDKNLIIITDQRLATPACLAQLPQMMVFAMEMSDAAGGHENAATMGRKRLRRLVSLHGKPCMEVVFSHAPAQHPDAISAP